MQPADLILAMHRFRGRFPVVELSMKVIGNAPGPATYWQRWGRLQRTAGTVIGGLSYPRGLYRFATIEEADSWQDHHRLHRRDHPKTET